MCWQPRRACGSVCVRVAGRGGPLLARLNGAGRAGAAHAAGAGSDKQSQGARNRGKRPFKPNQKYKDAAPDAAPRGNAPNDKRKRTRKGEGKWIREHWTDDRKAALIKSMHDT